MFFESFFSAVLSGVVLRYVEFWDKRAKKKELKKQSKDRDKKLIHRISKKVIKYLELKKIKRKHERN